jgi:hypothetical protein
MGPARRRGGGSQRGLLQKLPKLEEMKHEGRQDEAVP